MMDLENSTNEKIRYVAFRLFLEKGYEATNIRDICREVGIKPSSLYFYYRSKQELFFSLYDEIWDEKVQYLENIPVLKQNLSPDVKLCLLFTKTMEYCSQNIIKQKFLLRYHLFPPEELISMIRDKFRFWTNRENNIASKIVEECLDKKILDRYKSAADYLREYVRFVNAHLTEMIISNIKMSDVKIHNLWLRFWNYIF
ncbi:MAG TPA: TetR/AcrR family transcriptional regulator [Clostridiales bacterium]|nr:TetR/AcrR family transcriptional regulator [Clostridiales bacterium]